MLFNGEEVGNDNSSVNTQTRINWSGPNAATFSAFYKSLLALRNGNPALQQGTVTWVANTGGKAIASYTRSDANGTFLVVINLSGAAATGTLSAPAAVAWTDVSPTGSPGGTNHAPPPMLSLMANDFAVFRNPVRSRDAMVLLGSYRASPYTTVLDESMLRPYIQSPSSAIASTVCDAGTGAIGVISLAFAWWPGSSSLADERRSAPWREQCGACASAEVRCRLRRAESEATPALGVRCIPGCGGLTSSKARSNFPQMQTATFEPRSFLHRTERGASPSVPAPTVFLFEYRGYTDDGFMQFVEDVWKDRLANQTSPSSSPTRRVRPGTRLAFGRG
jgi:hypothetical protein